MRGLVAFSVCQFAASQDLFLSKGVQDGKCCFNKWGGESDCGNYPDGATGGRCFDHPEKTCTYYGDCSAAPTPGPAPPAGKKHVCLKACLDTDKLKNFNNCNHDGSSTCAYSKCCQDEKYTCYTKNQYYSACTPKCNPNVPDSMGDKWDCTPMSPSSCSTLQPCAEGCFGSAELAVAANASVAEVWDCSAYADKDECIDAHCKTPDDKLNAMWKKICTDNCAATPASKCPTDSLTSCIKTCKPSGTCDSYQYRACADNCYQEC